MKESPGATARFVMMVLQRRDVEMAWATGGLRSRACSKI
jgi:hypothetical protein